MRLINHQSDYSLRDIYNINDQDVSATFQMAVFCVLEELYIDLILTETMIHCKMSY